MADYGFKVSKTGFNILTADLKDQIINSSANSLKIWITGSINISVTGGFATDTVTVAHGLGYPPFFFTYFKLKDANRRWFQDSDDNSRLLTNFNHGFATTDNTNLNLSIFSDEGAGYTATAYYILFIDKAIE